MPINNYHLPVRRTYTHIIQLYLAYFPFELTYLYVLLLILILTPLPVFLLPYNGLHSALFTAYMSHNPPLATSRTLTLKHSFTSSCNPTLALSHALLSLFLRFLAFSDPLPANFSTKVLELSSVPSIYRPYQSIYTAYTMFTEPLRFYRLPARLTQSFKSNNQEQVSLLFKTHG